jgi:hypothetical protein
MYSHPDASARSLPTVFLPDSAVPVIMKTMRLTCLLEASYPYEPIHSASKAPITAKVTAMTASQAIIGASH